MKHMSVAMAAALSFAVTEAYAWEQPFVTRIASSDALKVTPDSFSTVSLTVWIVRSVCVVATTVLIRYSARRVRDDDYYGAGKSFLAAMIAGIAPSIAEHWFLT